MQIKKGSFADIDTPDAEISWYLVAKYISIK